MRLLHRLRAYLTSVPSRVDGSFVSPGSESVTNLSTRAEFKADEALERKIAAARIAMGTVEMKPLRMVGQNSDFGEVASVSTKGTMSLTSSSRR